jgi:GntR family transcriptional regulator/MocR family aminotransferase
MSPTRRAALLAFAAARNAVVVEDDYDGEFRHTDRPLDALKTLDRDGRVFYVGTFSKCLFPAVRTGYVVAPEWALAALGDAKRCADGQGATLMQDTLAAFIAEGHLARHVRRMGRLYSARRAVLLDGLAHGFGGLLEPSAPAAGLHLAARCVGGLDAEVLAAQALRQGVRVPTLRDFALRPLRTSGLVFGFGATDERAIRAGLRHLGAALGLR